jgi:hypothetical protein
MAERSTVQLFSSETPPRHKAIHQRPKALIMVPLQKVHHLMYQDVFQALGRFLGEFQIQPNSARVSDSTTPSAGASRS